MPIVSGIKFFRTYLLIQKYFYYTKETGTIQIQSLKVKKVNVIELVHKIRFL